MEFICYNLAQHKDKNVIYFVGLNSNGDSLIALLKMTNIPHLYIAFEDDYRQDEVINKLEEEGFNNLQYIKKHEINSNYQGYTFVFDKFVNMRDMVNYSLIRPNKIVGYFDNDFNTAKLWNGLRDNCPDITLSRHINYYRNETLEWKKEDNNDIELSVIFPVYNVANYLDKCLESVTKWDAPYVEYIFVDDGSKDNSAEIIKKWMLVDKRVKLLQKENGGCASARQFGIDNAKGRYIGLIDPDDFIDPTMFKKLLYRALTGTYDIAYSGYNEYYEDTKTSQKIEDYIGFPFTMGTSNREEIDSLIAYRRIAIWRGIYRRQFLIDNNIKFHIALRRFDDLPFKVETFARAKSVASVEEYLYYYRMGRPGQDVSANDERLYVHFDIFKILDEFFEKGNNSDQLRYYRIVKIQTHYWALTLLDNKYIKEYLDRASKDLNITNNPTSWKKLFSTQYKKQDVDKIMKIIKSV